MCDATRASGKMFACLYIKFLQSLNVEGGPENCKKNQYTTSTKPLKINKKYLCVRGVQGNKCEAATFK